MNDVNLESRIQVSPIEAGINPVILSVVAFATRGLELQRGSESASEGYLSGQFLANDLLRECKCLR